MNTAPYIHCGQSTTLQMLDAAIALLPVAAGSVWFFGLRAAAMLLLAVAAAAAAQYLWDRFTGRQELPTLTFLVTGLLSALLLPARAALWMAPLGAVIAISVKVLTGGIGQNWWNPAAVGRAILLPLLCPLALKDCQGPFLMAYRDGALGEVSTLLLLVGAAYLAMRRLLPWAVSIPYLCTAFLTAVILPGCDPIAMVCWGGTLLGACFFSADPVTTPMGFSFRVLCGAFTGAAATVFSFYGWGIGGVAIAVLAANTAFRAAETVATRLQSTAESVDAETEETRFPG